MTAAVLDRPAPGTGACRFPSWCNGSCGSDSQVSGELNHWSTPKQLTSGEFYDTVGVELYGYEYPGNDSPVVVCLAVGDDDIDIASTTLTPPRARELGNVLLGVQPDTTRYHDVLLWHDVDQYGLEVHVELRQPRCRRNGTETRLTVEVSIRDGARSASARTHLDLLDAWTLARWLIEAAVQADQSNSEHQSTLEGTTP